MSMIETRPRMAIGKLCPEKYRRCFNLLPTERDAASVWERDPTGSEKKGSLWEIKGYCTDLFNPTVDGSEIRLSPVDMVVFSIIYRGFSAIPGGLPDFFHQQYAHDQKQRICTEKKHISWIQFHGTNARWLPRYMNGLKFMVNVPKKTQRTSSFEGQPPKQGRNSNQNKGPDLGSS